MTITRRRLSAALALVLTTSTSAAADSLGDDYRRATPGQRLAYMELVIKETRFKSQPPERVRALAAYGRKCADDWDPRLEPDFAAHVGACIVLANRQVPQ